MEKCYKSIKEFTLIEVMVSLFLAAMIAFFVYTMMVYSYEGFNRLTDASKNSDDIRFLISHLRNSLTYAKTVTFSASELTVTRYDKNANKNVTETYTFESGGKFVNKPFSNLISYLNTYSDYGNRGLLFRKVENEKILVSNCVRAVYYDITTPSDIAVEGGGFKKVTLGIVYDEVLGGKKNTDGSVGNNSIDTTSYELKRRLVSFTSRSAYA